MRWPGSRAGDGRGRMEVRGGGPPGRMTLELDLRWGGVRREGKGRGKEEEEVGEGVEGGVARCHASWASPTG